MKTLHMVTFILIVIGGLNWGLEAFNFGIGRFIPEILAMVVYVLIGLSAIFELISHKKCCKMCSAKDSGGAPSQQMPA